MSPDRAYAVRAALPEDAPGIARVHRRAWHEAYDELMGADVIDERPVSELEEGWRVRLEVDEPDGIVAVGVSPSGEILGFASGGPTRDDDGSTAWELYAVNIVATAYGTGLGGDLVRAVTGDRANTLWVLVDNGRARAFYAKHGFVDEGGRKVHDASGCAEMRMIRPAPGPQG